MNYPKESLILSENIKEETNNQVTEDQYDPLAISYDTYCINGEPSIKIEIKEEILETVIDGEYDEDNKNKTDFTNYKSEGSDDQNYCTYNDNVEPKDSEMKRKELLPMQERRKYTCNECHKVYTANRRLQRHIMRVHMCMEDYFRKKCGECGETFTEAYLKPHTNRVHRSNKTFICDLCNKIFSGQIMLTEHLNIAHRQIIFKCEHCNAVFHNSWDLQDHSDTVHKNMKKYKCNKCNSMFSQNTKLESHISVVHKGIKNYKCDECNKLFSQKGNLKTHIIEKHCNKYQCNDCPVRFHCKRLLRAHVTWVAH